MVLLQILVCASLLPSSAFTSVRLRTCPGIKEYPSDVRFKTKNLREWGEPFNRLDSNSCLLWHLPSNNCRPTGDLLQNACAPCKRLQFDIDMLVKRARSTSDVKKATRTLNYPMKYLSPRSKAIRISRNTKERKNLRAKVSALTPSSTLSSWNWYAPFTEKIQKLLKSFMLNRGGHTCLSLCYTGHTA